jgi:hypothetical protein
MIKKMIENDIKKRKVFNILLLLFIFMFFVIGPPLWLRAATVEKIEALTFSPDDQDRVKVVMFYTLNIEARFFSWSNPTVYYELLFKSLSSFEPQRYKIIINPFEINTFTKSETFAYEAGRTMGVDVVVLIRISTPGEYTYLIEYTSINIRNQKEIKNRLEIFTHENRDPLEHHMTIAKQLFNNLKPFLSSVTVADTTPREAVSESAALEIAANVAGATVTLDDEKKGVTPLTVADIAPGQYTVQVKKEGYQTYEERVRVEGGKTLKLDVSLKAIADTGTINVSGSPKGAKVYLDGYYCCALPCTIGSVAKGKHTVMVKNPGYRDWDLTVDVPAGQKLQFEVVLKRTSTPKAAPQKKQKVGKVTSINGDSLELNLGAQEGIKVGDTGKVFYNWTNIDGNVKTIYVVTFKVIKTTEKSCTAQIEKKASEVQVGYLVEINQR